MTDQEYLELQEDLKEEFDFVKETAIDFYHDFDLGDEHYRTEGDRGGIAIVIMISITMDCAIELLNFVKCLELLQLSIRIK